MVKLHNGKPCLECCALYADHYLDKSVNCPRPCVFDISNMDKEVLVKILLEHIDKNQILARKIAGELLHWGYESAVRYADSELDHQATMFGNDPLEIYYTEERKEWERLQKELYEEWAAEFYADYPKDEFGRPIIDSSWN